MIEILIPDYSHSNLKQDDLERIWSDCITKVSRRGRQERQGFVCAVRLGAKLSFIYLRTALV